MKKIALLSDTHSYIDDKIIDFIKEADEIWHAGDIGNPDILNRLKSIKPVRAVYGNIDGAELRAVLSESLYFNCERVKVFITHIGGYPKKYAKGIKQKLKEIKPQLFIAGHSHILKVIYDKELELLYINPGAAGKSGFHKVRTALRFNIDADKIKNLEILEMKR
ncbi:MAG: metallophosphatase family protein [Bacteroidales bacterium]|nr:metallophosphatase family protein [Bacteroidales bacterium]